MAMARSGGGGGGDEPVPDVAKAKAGSNMSRPWMVKCSVG